VIIDEKEEGRQKGSEERKLFCETGKHTCCHDDSEYRSVAAALCDDCRDILAQLKNSGEFRDGECLACFGFMLGCGDGYSDRKKRKGLPKFCPSQTSKGNRRMKNVRSLAGFLVGRE
jgi:hypothetical protein